MPETETHNPEKVLSIAQNVARVQERIRQAALRVGRDPASVRLVAASKTVDTARIRAAIAAGVTIIGENYLQEARDKIGQLGRHGVEWHLIGTLQRNKVRYMFDLFDMMHSLDSLTLAEEINRRGERLGRRAGRLEHTADERAAVADGRDEERPVPDGQPVERQADEIDVLSGVEAVRPRLRAQAEVDDVRADRARRRADRHGGPLQPGDQVAVEPGARVVHDLADGEARAGRDARVLAVVGRARLDGPTGDLAFFDHGGTTGPYVYLGGARGGPGCPAGVRIVSVRNPRAPRLVATAGGIPGVTYEDVEVRRIGRRVVLAVGIQRCADDGAQGLALYDVTRPARPRAAGCSGSSPPSVVGTGTSPSSGR